jgi:hypothetical protein
MKVGLSLISEVGQDLSAAYSWYNERRIGLGEEFLTCVDACIQSICRRPNCPLLSTKNFAEHWFDDSPIQFFMNTFAEQ